MGDGSLNPIGFALMEHGLRNAGLRGNNKKKSGTARIFPSRRAAAASRIFGLLFHRLHTVTRPKSIMAAMAAQLTMIGVDHAPTGCFRATLSIAGGVVANPIVFMTFLGYVSLSISNNQSLSPWQLGLLRGYYF